MEAHGRCLVGPSLLTFLCPLNMEPIDGDGLTKIITVGVVHSIKDSLSVVSGHFRFDNRQYRFVDLKDSGLHFYNI